MEFFYPTANFVQANFALKFCRTNISFIPQPHFFCTYASDFQHNIKAAITKKIIKKLTLQGIN